MAEPASAMTAGPGSILRTEREALGVTLREVSETLNLSITVIQAIEADQFQRLPGPVFARGYIRAYARLLNLEPEPLLARSPRLTPADEQAGASESAVRGWIRRRPGLVLGIGAAVLLIVALIAATSLWPSLQTGAETDAIEPGVDMPVGSPGGIGQDVHGWDPDPSRTAPPGAARSLDVLQEVEDIAEDVLGGGENARSPVAADVTGEAAQPSSSGPRRLTASGDERLMLRFSADCWVQVRDARGSDLYSELSRAGDELELVGQGPLRILLGYAPGVQLAFNGEPVPLGPHTRNNVATLVLGQ
jgi:cytoskeleton protein RodZ